MAAINGFHHVVLTVKDAEASSDWHQDLFGLTEVVSRDADDASLRVLLHAGSGVLLGLRQPKSSATDSFDERRTGLDHFAFRVQSRQELEAWEAELSRRGLGFSPIAETSIGSVIVLRDPDNIQLDLYLPSP